MNGTGSHFLAWGAVAALSILVTGCDSRKVDSGLPPTLRIGVLPDESRESLIERYEPLREHLAETLGIPCELIFPESYDALVESFCDGTVGLAHFGGLTFVKAKLTHNAVPLVVRDVDLKFTSYFVTRSDNPAKTIEDCKDETLAFGSRLSTSGHLMPRHFLALRDMPPETFFKNLRYSGAHDTTVEWVRDGVVTIGAVNSLIFKEMLADGRIKKGELHILWETPPYADNVWAVQPSFGKIATSKLRDAFLALSPAHQAHEAILSNLDAGGFLPVDVEAFSDLETIASAMEFR